MPDGRHTVRIMARSPAQNGVAERLRPWESGSATMPREAARAGLNGANPDDQLPGHGHLSCGS